ncbi:MAG TPA: hypothetical protein VFQ42_04260 [Mycobacterium sp.]|nr:hypothetical protein [Mycobacterium sp.]
MGDYTDASPFLECQAILAAQEDDTEALTEILRKMLPGELDFLQSAADRLDRACGDALASGNHA